MPKMIRKGDLPQKICATCGRPFAWRKKWERVWDEVRHCSDRCRSHAGPRSPSPSGGRRPGPGQG
jgi:hypothetical protein